jgi:hypothetical protein
MHQREEHQPVYAKGHGAGDERYTHSSPPQEEIGIAPVITTPVTSELYGRETDPATGFLNVRRIISPMITSSSPPATPVACLTTGIVKYVANPKYIRAMMGISMIPCPNPMNTPAFLSGYPLAIVAAVSGPGSITPDSEIPAAEIR